MKEKLVRKMGDKLIKSAAKPWTPCVLGLFHEVEKPECLKKLDAKRMQEAIKEEK